MIQRLETVVLRSRPLREADLWVSLATPQGRMVGIANGALKSRKRFPSGFPTGAYGTVTLREGPDLAAIQEIQLEGQASLTTLAHLGAMGIVLELVDKTWPLHQAGVEKFRHLQGFVSELANHTAPGELLVGFLWEWLALLGVRPQLDTCVRCQIPHQAAVGWRLVPESGGVLCPRCLVDREEGLALGSRREVIRLWIERVLEIRLKSVRWWKTVWPTE